MSSASVTVKSLEYQVPEKRILHDINVEVPGGEILAIMGQSGSGKTSLLKCISGLVKPTSGQVLIGDEDIVPMSESELDRIRLKIGLVFQYAALFDSLTVYENVAFGLINHRKMSAKEMRRIVAERLEEVGMSGIENLYPSQLSGGMQKRVGLARSLATEPSVLLYDEPTSGLDPVIANSIDELIVQTRDRNGMTSIIVSHDIPSIFRIADKIIMIHQGEMVAYGTPEELRASEIPMVQEFVKRK